MVATPRTAAEAVSAQPKESVAMLLVPSPQNNMAGLAKTCFTTVTLNLRPERRQHSKGDQRDQRDQRDG